MIERAQNSAAALGIKALLADPNFGFELSPEYFLKIHGAIFGGVLEYAGKLRRYPLTWDLFAGRDEVEGERPEKLAALLADTMRQERQFFSAPPDTPEIIAHIARLNAFLWGTHYFEGGNTRTTTIFTIKYLRALGYNVENAPFIAVPYLYKNALARACFAFPAEGEKTDKYVILFLRNVVLGEHNEIRFKTEL